MRRSRLLWRLYLCGRVALGGLKKMKVLVVYHSKYGNTKQYAEWIQEGFQTDLIDLINYLEVK